MFLVLLSLLGAWHFTRVAAVGPRRAAAEVWFVGVFFGPVWVTTMLRSIIVDFRTGAALLGFLGFQLRPVRAPRHPWVLGDLLVAWLLLSQVISQYLAGDLRPLTAFEMARKWVLPYVVGRIIIREAGDIRRLMPFIVKLAGVVSLLSIFEAGTKLNLLQKALGRVYAVLEAGEGYRYGLKRAQLAMDHPIFFGMALALLLPWLLEAARQAEGKRLPRLMPYIALVGIVATVSRGAVLVGLAALGGVFWFRRPPRLRIVLAVLGIALGVFAYTSKDAVLELIGKAASEEQGRIIVIDGEEVLYTGTSHRLLLFRVYAKAIREAGAFGYGFRMIGVPLDPEHAQRFGSIDNHYLLMLLRHGWLGISGFALLALCALVYLLRAGWRRELPQAGLAGGLCAALFGVTGLLMTVWFSFDFGAMWLFSCGVASSLHCLPRTVAAEADAPAPAPPPRFILPPRRTAGIAFPLPEEPDDV